MQLKTSRLRAFSSLSALVLVAGCYSLYDYVGPSDGAYKHGSGPTPVNPGEYQVDGDLFPEYRVTTTRQPPPFALMDKGVLRIFREPTNPILPTDSWKVRYRFKNFLLVNSIEFDRRECRDHSTIPLKKDGTCNYDWCLYISEGGSVTGGWGHCTPGGDKRVFSPDPDVVRLQDWGQQPFFSIHGRR